MKYGVKRDNYRNFEVFQINREEPRAYFIPFGDKDKLDKCAFTRERYESDRIFTLSGEWDFSYLRNCTTLPEELDTDCLKWDKVKVPSTWQHTGYEKPFYLNRRYQFPKKPPSIPSDIPVGIYRKKFDYKPDEKTLITFLGVCSCVELYINGAFVGYSEASHDKAEFDISEFIKDGENEIVALVYKFCNGSYLECQDMYRENGIFRDVYLTALGKECLRDVRIKTQKRGGRYDLKAYIAAQGKELRASLKKDGQTVVEKNIGCGETMILNFDGLDVAEWSAETPELYEFSLELSKTDGGTEYARFYVGFKDAKIEGNVFLFNGAKIKFKGVNHHDSDPEKGYAVGVEEHERDVKLMKAYNVNAVRCSHYPKDPVFLSLCDFYGLYVIDEADIETHGFYNIPSSNSANRLSNAPAWKEHYLDRVKSMVSNDFNHCSVAMWSLGNESGGWKNQDVCAEYIKSVSDIPVHYEGVSHNKRNNYDVFSEMYPSHARIKAVADGSADERFLKAPYFMCEYAHSMGVGPGGLKEYWDIIYGSDNMAGGCIWEFADHSAYIADGKYKWTYGGDHNEFIHDKNFCVDGLFYPSREPHTGAKQMRWVYRPLRASYKGGGVFAFENTDSFRNAGRITVNYKVSTAGLSQASGSFKLEIPAGESREIVLDFDKKPDTVIEFSYTDGEHRIAEEEIVLEKPVCAFETGGGSASFSVEKNLVKVDFKGGTLTFDKKRGAVTGYKLGDKELLDGEIHNNVSRAPIDNEMFINILFKILGFNRCAVKGRFKSVTRKNGTVVLKYVDYCKLNIGSIKFSNTLEIFGDGTMFFESVRGNGCLAISQIPRIGLRFKLDKAFDNIVYYGKNAETYADICDYAATEVTSLRVSGFNEPYIKPQENGNRAGVRWAQVTDAEGDGVKISALGEPFNLSAHDYSLENLMAAGHVEDLNRDANEVFIDSYTRPVGTNSCGPLPLKKYLYDKKKSFALLIQPLNKTGVNE